MIPDFKIRSLLELADRAVTALERSAAAQEHQAVSLRARVRLAALTAERRGLDIPADIDELNDQS